jgi:sigma-E factor negative regulatory protein RseA
MSDQLYEQISAFVDGELQEHETELLFKRLEREPELRARLVRYSTIGASLREEAGRGVTRSFAARVSAAIASAGAEPPGQPLHARLNPRWLRTIAGLGVAATVAAVAILGVQQLQAPVSGAATQVAATSPASQPIFIGDLPSSAPSYTVPAPTTDVPLVPAARLTNYVVAHSQYSSAFGRRNMLSGIISEDPTPVDEAGEPVSPPPVTQP